MAWRSLKLVAVTFAVSLVGCSDDGVVGGDALTTAGSTGATGASSASDGDSSPGASTGSEDSDTDSVSTGIDPSGPTSGGSTSEGPTTGGSSTGGGSGGPICTARCEVDEDCFNDGVDSGLTCSDQGFCELACEEAEDCIPLLSAWVVQTCETNEACPAGPCVDYGGDTGGCGIDPPKGESCNAIDVSLAEYEATDIEGNTVTVCAVTGGTCSPGIHGSDTCQLLTCETEGCPEPLVCNEAGHCECATNLDCVEAGTGDTCSEAGFCAFGCADAEECEAVLGPPPLDGQVLVCE